MMKPNKAPTRKSDVGRMKSSKVMAGFLWGLDESENFTQLDVHMLGDSFG